MVSKQIGSKFVSYLVLAKTCGRFGMQSGHSRSERREEQQTLLEPGLAPR